MISRTALVAALIALSGCQAAAPATLTGAAPTSGPTAPSAISAPAAAADDAFVAEQMPGVTADMLAGAKSEGQLTVYYGTWADAEEGVLEGFKKHFPYINVQTYTATAAQVRQKFESEARGGRAVADITQDSDPSALDADVKEGLLANYTIGSDAQYGASQKRSGYWYPLRVALVGIAWNMDRVSEQEAATIHTWSDLADPIWSGRMGVVSAKVGGVAYLPWFVWTTTLGDDFLQKLAANKPRVFDGINPAAAALASGDIALLANASETGTYPLWTAGAPIRWDLPDPAVGAVTAQAIAATAPHPNAARLLQEYTFSLEGYTLFQKYQGVPARIGMADQRTQLAQSGWYHIPDQFYPYDEQAAGAAQQGIYSRFDQLFTTH